EAEATELLAAGVGREETFFLLVGAVLRDRVAIERVVHAQRDARARAAARDLLDGEGVGDIVHARPAPVGGNGDAAETELERLLHRLGRETMLAVPLLRVGPQLPVGELAAGVAQEALLFAEIDLHQAPCARRLRAMTMRWIWLVPS